jgi:myosin heavy subunit
MEEEICQYNKFGFCRYRSDCKKKHYKSECEHLDDCNTQKNCPKRHPKRCRKYDSGNCRFQSDCAYKHLQPKTNEDHKQLKQKLEALEKVVQTFAETNKDKEQLQEKVEGMEKVLKAMTRKVLSLETELKRMKERSRICTAAEGPKDTVSEDVNDMETKTKKETSGENLSFDHNEIKGTTSTPNEKKNIVEKLDSKIEMLKCKECNYSCKKEKSLKNHTLTKHENLQCKECQEKLPNLMQLLKHVAENHSKDQSETKDIEFNKEDVVRKDINERDELEELEAELSSLKKELLLK